MINQSNLVSTTGNIGTLNNEVDWLSAVIDQVIKSYFMQEGYEGDWLDIPPPDLTELNDPYSQSVKKWELDVYARLALVLSMAPHLRPEALDVFFGKNQVYDRGFSEFGGVVDKNHSGFLPTCQTFLFLVAGVHPELRTTAMETLGNESILIKEQVLVLGSTEPGMPGMNGILGLSNDWFYYFITGKELREENTASFPAQKIATHLDWQDVVLDDHVYEQVMEIRAWMEHSNMLMNNWGPGQKNKTRVQGTVLWTAGNW
ncbi:MAG: hypothetical protein WDO19_15660 [Bacteroidota bacterium]